MSENQNKLKEENVVDKVQVVDEEQLSKAKALLSDADFVSQFLKTTSVEAAQELFKQHGVELSREDLTELGKFINEHYFNKTNASDKTKESDGVNTMKKLSPDELKNCAGGRSGLAQAARYAVSPIVFVAKTVVGGTIGALGGLAIGAADGISWASK